MEKLRVLLSIPRSLFYNVKLFGLRKGMICPILINNNVCCKGIEKGKINILNENLYRGMIQIGFGGSLGISENRKALLAIGENGRIVFKGTAGFSEGVSIRVDSGIFEVGEAFSCNKNCFFSCSKGVTIGNEVKIGWNVNVRDSDGHQIYINGVQSEPMRSVNIGNHVWIASFVDILKGAVISDETVVAYRSCVTKQFLNKNCLIAGHPAKIIRKDVSWKE